VPGAEVEENKEKSNAGMNDRPRRSSDTLFIKLVSVVLIVILLLVAQCKYFNLDKFNISTFYP
jgi:hypothetical protein